MITLWRTGEFDYKDSGIDKPVNYTIENLIEVASRTPRMDITKDHSKDVIGEMSNFIVEDGLLKADEPNNLELSGMGFSPVFEFDLVDMGEYYVPRNIVMTEIGYTKTPRSKIVYNSIEVQNEDSRMDDKQLRDALDNNKKLNEDIGVLKSQIKQLKKANQEKDKEIKKIKDSYSDSESKLKEYDGLKEIESKYNSLVASKKDDLIHQISNGNKKIAEKYQNFSIEDLEIVKETMTGVKGSKGITPHDTVVDDGNIPPQESNDDEYTDEMFEKEFAESGL